MNPNCYFPPEPATLVNTDPKNHNGVPQIKCEGKVLDGLPIYLVRGDKGVVQALNVPARNEVAHKNPDLLKHALAKAFQRRADKEGLHEDVECVVRWKPSAIPFHIEYEISASGNTCQHLASVRKITAKDPVSMRLYALLTSLTVESRTYTRGTLFHLQSFS